MHILNVYHKIAQGLYYGRARKKYAGEGQRKEYSRAEDGKALRGCTIRCVLVREN
jgi:hypothetical protein